MTNVFPDDPQRSWDEYYHRKREQRANEAVLMCQQLDDAGVSQDTVVALDFCLFGSDRSNAEQLAEQLGENYQMDVGATEEGYWLISGTTRPYGLTMGKDEHFEWVRFMCDVARSHSCVFSTWSVDVPSLGIKFDSAELERSSQVKS